MITYQHRYKTIKQKVPFALTTNQKMLLMPVGDIHFGSKGWPKTKFVDHLKWGMERGAWFLGVGEYLDFASFSQRKQMAPLRDHVKDQISHMLNEQTWKFYDLISFTKGRWIGLLEGDHFWEYEDGTTCDQMLCRLLGAKFLGTSSYIRLTPNDSPKGHHEADTIVYVHHGIGSARLAGSHLHRVEDMLKWIDADIYLMGHTHAKVSAPLDRQYITPDEIHYHRTKIIARTGGFMRGYYSQKPMELTKPAAHSRGSYIEQRAYTPSAMGGLCIGIGYEKIDKSTFYRPTLHYSV